jgi:serine/threonine protein kinase
VLPGTVHHAALSRFEILQELSPEGGQKVLLGKSKAGKLAAIKVLVTGPIPEDVASGLSREASLGARLAHETIVQMRALLLEADFAAIVTEFVPGVSLQRLLRFAAARQVRLPDDAALYVLERVFTALAYAHGTKDEAGNVSAILHRSVSPTSIVVGWDGVTKIGDFGMSRMRSLVANLVPQDAPLDLMAPEQSRGSAASERSDVFCGALVALRLATGRTPYARFRRSATEMLLAMSEGSVTRLAKTRPDLPPALRDAFDRALEPDHDKRSISSKEVLDVIRSHVDVPAGREALQKLLARWREQMEKSVTPWEKRASIPDGAPTAGDGVHEAALALAMPDDRPSSESLVSRDTPDAPWKRDSHVDKEEAPLAPTGAQTSLSRVGATASDALTMPPLPPMRVTAPSIPVYGGPVAHLPREVPKQKFFSGGRAAATIFVVFILMCVGAYFLFKSLGLMNS